MDRCCIALDAMGGDHGPVVVIPAALDALEENPALHIILVGDEALLTKHLSVLKKKFKADIFERLDIKHASQAVDMNEPPAIALRSKRDSSMRVAINLVKTKQAAACVSAGNTGALMAIAKFVLKMLPGIDRPAIIYSLPTDTGQEDFGFVRMLDLGANVDCSAEHLVQFAVMGSVLASAAGQSAPRVGLLNIGSEAIKGNESIKKASSILSESQVVNYIGYVEGNGIFSNKADVVVCDGFAGNVALKCTEGVASLLLRLLKREFKRNLYTLFLAFIMKPMLKRLLKQIDPAGYNGASLLGLKGVVIKSHGNAKRAAFKQAIREAVLQAKENVPERIRTEVMSKLSSLTEQDSTDEHAP